MIIEAVEQGHQSEQVNDPRRGDEGLVKHEEKFRFGDQ
jgi:hypothetical protein